MLLLRGTSKVCKGEATDAKGGSAYQASALPTTVTRPGKADRTKEDKDAVLVAREIMGGAVTSLVGVMEAEARGTRTIAGVVTDDVKIIVAATVRTRRPASSHPSPKSESPRSSSPMKSSKGSRTFTRLVN